MPGRVSGEPREVLQMCIRDSGDTGALLDITQSLLADARTALNSSGVLSVPIAELSTLGAGVSSLIPALNTVTQTTSIAADGLYTLSLIHIFPRKEIIYASH